jgi:hypothetical protein
MADTNPTETTPAPDAPVVESQAAPETPTLSPRVQKLVEEFGFENIKDEGEALERLTAYTQNLKNEFGSQLQSAIEQVKQTTPQPTTQAQEAQGDSWWNPPQYDQSLVAKYRQADGSWKPETPADVRQQADAAQAYYDRWASDLVHRPHEVLPKLIRQEAEKIVRELHGQTQQQQQLTQFQQRVFTENKWLFEPDPVTGQPSQKLSVEGELIDRYMREAQQRGADYEFAWDYAFTKHQAAKAAAQAKQTAQTKTAEEINAEKKAELLRRSAPGLNRGASLPTPSETRTSQRNPNLTPGQRAMQIRNRNGQAVH